MPLDETALKGLLEKLGVPAFAILRTKEPEFKALGLNEQTPEDDIIAAVAAHPNLLNRPIVEVGNKAVIARPAERALELIKK